MVFFKYSTIHYKIYRSHMNAIHPYSTFVTNSDVAEGSHSSNFNYRQGRLSVSVYRGLLRANIYIY